MTKIKFNQKLVENLKNQLTRRSKILTIGLALCGTILSGVVSFNMITTGNLLGDKSAYAAVIAGGSAAGGANAVSIDKKFCSAPNVCNDEVSNILGGGTVTVRLNYDNTGNRAITNAAIKDSLPSSFTYVAGSLKNCLNPTASEIACDTLNPTQKDTAFGMLTGGGLSPTSGLYDLGVQNQGILETGKKRYIQMETDKFSGDNEDTFDSCNLIADNSPTVVILPFCNGRNASAVAPIKYDTLNKRYIHTKIGGYNDANQDHVRNCGLFVDNSSTFVDATFPAQYWCGGGPTYADTLKETADLLGYANLQYQNDGQNGFYANHASCNLKADNTITFVEYGICPLGNKNSHFSTMKVSLLDASRGKGYIEYQINTPIGNNGSFGTEARIEAGTGALGVNSLTTPSADSYNVGVDNTIVVTSGNGVVINSVGCLPINGSTVFTDITCTANIPANSQQGATITITSETAAAPITTMGSCITPAILFTNTSVSCTFRATTNPASLINLVATATASTGGLVLPGNISNLFKLNTTTCPNGAITPPACNTCPSGQTLVTRAAGANPAANNNAQICVPNCINSAVNPTNYPATNCTQCPANMAWTGSACYPCSNGGCTNSVSFYSNTIPYVNTANCNNGTNNPISCNGCLDQGKYFDIGNPAPNGSCVICPAGKTCNGGSAAPVTCPIDTYCPAGAITPTPCGTGLNSLAGSTVVADCKQIVKTGTVVGPASCSPNSVAIGQTLTCDWNLTPGTNYILGDLFGGVMIDANNSAAGLYGNGTQCTIGGGILTCTGIPTTGSTLGTKRVMLHRPGIEYIAVGGNISVIAATSTTTCPVGQSLISGSCVVCAAGSYCPGGALPAVQCPINTYCLAGSPSATNCPSGTTSPVGTVSQSGCIISSAASSSNSSTPAANCTNGANNPPTCTTCPSGQSLVASSCIANCTNGTTNPPTCTTCPSGQSLVSNACVINCTNGANNPPTCTTCPSGQTLVASSCVANCTNGTTNPPTCTTCPSGQSLVTNSCIANCTNGANNPPTCTTCPSGQTLVASSCVANCTNGTSNPPTCTTCPSGQSLVTNSCIANCTNGATNPPTCTLTLGTASASPVSLVIGTSIPTIALTGNTIPNNTPATISFVGGLVSPGTIQNNSFVPASGQVITSQVVGGISNAVIEVVGIPSVQVPLNLPNPTVPANDPNSIIYTFGAAVGTPINQLINNTVSSISLNGNTIPNSTVANLTFAGSASSILGTIQNNTFVPNANQLVPSGVVLGNNTAVLTSPRSTNLNLPYILTVPTVTTITTLGTTTSISPIIAVAGQNIPSIPLTGSTVTSGTAATLTITGTTTPITGTITGNSFVPASGQVLPVTIPNGLNGGVISTTGSNNLPVQINFNNGTTPPTTTTVLGTNTNVTPLNIVAGQAPPTIQLTGSTVPSGTVATLTLPGNNTPITGTITSGSFIPNTGQVIPASALTGSTIATITTANAPSITVPLKIIPTSTQPNNTGSCAAGTFLNTNNVCAQCPINQYCLINTSNNGANGTQQPINCPAGTTSFAGSSASIDCKTIRAATSEDIRTSITCTSSQLIASVVQKCFGQLSAGITVTNLRLRFLEDVKTANLNGFRIGFMATGDQITEVACTVSNTGTITCPDVNLGNYTGTVRVIALSNEVTTPVGVYNYTVVKSRNVTAADLTNTNIVKCTVTDSNSKTFANCSGQLPLGVQPNGMKVWLNLNDNKPYQLTCSVDTNGKISCDPYDITGQTGSIDILSTTNDITTPLKIGSFDTAKKSCPAGQYGNGSNCAPCFAGYYCSDSISSKICEIGFFCPLSSVKPTPCPSGKTTKIFGAKSETDCVDINSLTTTTNQTVAANTISGVLTRSGGYTIASAFAIFGLLIGYFVIQNRREKKFQEWKKF